MAMSGATEGPPAAHSNSEPEQSIDVHQPFTPAERVQQLSQVDNDIASLLQHLASAMRALAAIPPDANQLANQLANNNNNNNNHSHHSLINGSSSSSSSPASSSPPWPDPTATTAAAAIADPLTSFRTAQTAFFHAVDRIDKQLTRQILALEEAGVITLRDGGGSVAVGGDQELSEAVTVADGGMIGGGAGAGAGAGATVAAAAAGRVTARLEPDGLGRYGGLDVGRLNMASSTVERDVEEELWRRAREHLGTAVEEEGGAGERMEE